MNRLTGRLAGLALVLALAWLPPAAAAGRAEALAQVLRLTEVIDILRVEGLEHGTEIGETMLGHRAGTAWQREIDRIYGAERMARLMGESFEAALPGSDEALDAIVAFFQSPRGQTLIGLEISARRAMLDDAVEEAARETLAEMRAAGDGRLALIERFAQANALVEENVAGGLNASFAFYMGLIEADTPGMAMSEADVLAEVWAQEAEIREDIESWLFAFLTLAYQPVSDEDLEAYIAFSRTPEGQALNLALFAGFNAMFEAISRDLGLAAGRMLLGEDL